MVVTSETCIQAADIFPAPGTDADLKYRFFNQPIEQIPGYDNDKPQILVHRPQYGLQWHNIDTCLQVVTCINLESSELVAERRSIVIIKDFESENCSVEVSECSTPTPSPS